MPNQPRSIAVQGAYGTERVSEEQRVSNSSSSRPSRRFFSACTSRDFPIPASPTIETSCRGRSPGDQAALELRELLATEQGRQLAALAAEGGRALGQAEHLVRRHRLARALHVEGTERSGAEAAAQERVGRLGDQDRARRGERLQARGEIGGVADRGVVHLQVVADGARTTIPV
jgi:hypothetical protein